MKFDDYKDKVDYTMIRALEIIEENEKQLKSYWEYYQKHGLMTEEQLHYAKQLYNRKLSNYDSSPDFLKESRSFTIENEKYYTFKVYEYLQANNYVINPNIKKEGIVKKLLNWFFS